MSEIKVASAELRNKAADFQNYISKFESERQNLVTAEQTLMTKEMRLPRSMQILRLLTRRWRISRRLLTNMWSSSIRWQKLMSAVKPRPLRQPARSKARLTSCG